MSRTSRRRLCTDQLEEISQTDHNPTETAKRGILEQDYGVHSRIG